MLIAGGGTGGHIIPALAVAHQLVTLHGADVLFLGTPRGMESRLVPAAGFELRMIEVGPLKNVSLATRVRTLADIPRSLFACRRLIREYKPDVVLGVGGYASGPGMAAAVMMRVPTMAFEPNAMPGLANRLVVGGGETAGAVINAIGIEQLEIGPEIDPGVPAMTARHGDRRVGIALKSGNFGAIDFYDRAIRILGDGH